MKIENKEEINILNEILEIKNEINEIQKKINLVEKSDYYSLYISNSVLNGSFRIDEDDVLIKLICDYFKNEKKKVENKLNSYQISKGE